MKKRVLNNLHGFMRHKDNTPDCSEVIQNKTLKMVGNWNVVDVRGCCKANQHLLTYF